MTILLVEDGDAVIRTVQDILYNYTPTKKHMPDITFDLTVAESFQSAYRHKDTKYDLVLLDDRLPENDNVPKNKYGSYAVMGDYGYNLAPAFKKTGTYLVGTSSGKRTGNFDMKWEKPGRNSWEDLLKILLFVAQEKKLL